MTDVPQWFSNPIKTNDIFRGDFYICTNCGGQSSGGIYSSVCPQCNGIQSDPPRSARLKYLCNTCARSPICKCDYPVAPRALTPTPPPRPNVHGNRLLANPVVVRNGTVVVALATGLDPVNEDENLQHHCLYVEAYIRNENDPRQIIPYCMGELSSKFKIKENKIDQKINFHQLSKQNITNQQLYYWSAPIDLIEKYQLYLNQLNNSQETSLGTNIFYNCTLPYFGPKCQYILNDIKYSNLPLNEIIHTYYYGHEYKPTLFTCYIHLECNRGPFPSCLDWREICDGQIDCMDDGYDEEHCWELEMNQCNENEYQCSNGRCIPKSFFRDGRDIPDCLDQSDEYYKLEISWSKCLILTAEPTFASEDISCAGNKHIGQYYILISSSCAQERTYLLFQAIFSIKPKAISDECWTAMKCMMKMPLEQKFICQILCRGGICNEIVKNMCPDIIFALALPLFSGHVFLVYNRSQVYYPPLLPLTPTYVCYNHQLLHVLIKNKTFLSFNNHTCRLYADSIYGFPVKTRSFLDRHIFPLYYWLMRNTISIYNNFELHNKSFMYKCDNCSKYISKTRLFDNLIDCPYGDDENLSLFNETCSEEEENSKYFKCKTTNQCIPRSFVQNGDCDCTYFKVNFCDDENFDASYAQNTISFQTICDGFTHRLPNSTDIYNETDETDCEQWPLIHIYNRCDGLWHHLDGSDELNCYSPSLLNCSANQHVCVSPKTNGLMCLPIEQANDGIIDCLGAADEPLRCPASTYHYDNGVFFCERDFKSYCAKLHEICNKYTLCLNEDDEQACNSSERMNYEEDPGICAKNYELHGSDVEKALCRHFTLAHRQWKVYFTLDQSQNLIKQYSKAGCLLMRDPPVPAYQQRCHRGLDLQVWLDKEKKITTNVCLCPPSYYGSICQYQNQRVSLTLQFLVTSDSVKIPLIIIVSLIDDSNESIIHSSEQFTYLSIKHCRRKFNIYLLYSTRPKDHMRHYSIQIDTYEKITLKYRSSIIKSLNYSFLPVHRLAFQINISHIPNDLEDCLDDECNNGKCIKYFNNLNNQTFCQCDEGWSGKFCTIKHNCTCSPGSLCMGKLVNNRSLCICPLNLMGPQCLINNTACHNNNTNTTCMNGGECIPVDEHERSMNKFTCICKGRFMGDRCEMKQTKLIISFDKTITKPLSIRIHFIQANVDASHSRTTTFKKNPFGQDSVTVYWSLPFHLVFAELPDKVYHLIGMQKTPEQSVTIEKTLNSSSQCLFKDEIFNQTIANFNLLRRIKYYHVPCQTNSSQLSCFYDEIHLCFCQEIDQQYVTNCFDFNHHMNLNCSGHSGCQNGGKCFQENTDCPRVSICECDDCFYGTQCEYSTNVYSLSLDVIIGYHIQPNIKISHQPYTVFIILILCLFIIIGGFINTVLLLITFKNKTTRESGCGIYLLSISIVTLLMMIIFLLKILILLLSQIGTIRNVLFLKIQCYSIDFLLRFSLAMFQSLTACIAIERAFVIIKGIQFNKNKSKLIAKWIIIGLILLTILTNIHDPIHRNLFEENEDEEKRFLCMIKYSSAYIRIINVITNIFQFMTPFIINLISSILIIIMSAKQQAKIQKKQKYKDILIKQIKQHRNLLIAPCVLVILAIPHLIISFTSGCVKSSSNSWLFLLGYLISLIPTLLTFVLFVLPSTVYRQAFKKAISQYRNIIRNRS